jgi:hypothetical protein
LRWRHAWAQRGRGSAASLRTPFLDPPCRSGWCCAQAWRCVYWGGAVARWAGVRQVRRAGEFMGSEQLSLVLAWLVSRGCCVGGERRFGVLVGWLFGRSCGGVPVCSLAVVLAFAALPWFAHRSARPLACPWVICRSRPPSRGLTRAGGPTLVKAVEGGSREDLRRVPGERKGGPESGVSRLYR